MTRPDNYADLLLILLGVIFLISSGYVAGRRTRRRPTSDRKHFNQIEGTYPETARDREPNR